MVAAAKTSLAAWPARARTSELSGGSWADGALCWAGWLGFGAAFFGMAARSKTLVAPSTPRPSDGRHVQSALRTGLVPPWAGWLGRGEALVIAASTSETPVGPSTPRVRACPGRDHDPSGAPSGHSGLLVGRPLAAKLAGAAGNSLGSGRCGIYRHDQADRSLWGVVWGCDRRVGVASDGWAQRPSRGQVSAQGRVQAA